MVRSIRELKDIPVASAEIKATRVFAIELERIARVQLLHSVHAQSSMYKGIQHNNVWVKESEPKALEK